MRKLNFVLMSLGLLFMACTQETTMNNPFLSAYDTPFEVPPFHLIEEEHYIPAFTAGIEEEKAEIDAIINNPAEPDFENTIVAFDNTGEILRRVGGVFYRLNGANTNPNMQSIAREITPMMSAHSNSIRLNEDLFERIKAVYDKRETLDLDQEQMRLVEKIYQDFASCRPTGTAERDQRKVIHDLTSTW